jgi:hypothetical protein
MSIDPIDTGSECDGSSCLHKAHGVGLMDDADAAAEAKERVLLAELAAARAGLAAKGKAAADEAARYVEMLRERDEELAAARAEVERLRQVLVQVDRCLEHVVNRPHEHNPVGPFQRVTCEIVTDAQAAVRAALSAAPPRATAEDFERLADVAEEGNRIAAASRRLRKELGLDDADAAAEAKERALLAEVEMLRDIVARSHRELGATPAGRNLLERVRAALGYEKPPPGSGTVGELIGLMPVEPATLTLPAEVVRQVEEALDDASHRLWLHHDAALFDLEAGEECPVCTEGGSVFLGVGAALAALKKHTEGGGNG